MKTSVPHSYTNNKSIAPKVLLVEDNLMNQRLAGFMLNHLGIGFDVCSDGATALDLVMKNTYQLILMDIEMPVMNGLNAAKEIRGTLKRNMPIVALTAYDSAEEINKCREAGMTDHLIKPLNEEAFLHVINKYLSVTSAV
jgi:CheY-like chemotaxis protein